MKMSTLFAFIKGTKKIFGVISFVLVGIFCQKATAQFTVIATGQATTQSSTGPITIQNIYFGKGQGISGSNIAIGNLTINNAASTASDNVAIGSAALQLINSGNYNTSVGNNSMRGAANFSNVSSNCALGISALEYLADNSTDNCAFGNQALKKIASGKWNVAMGSIAGFNNTGDSNTFVGSVAGYTNTTGNGNVALGFGAGGLSTGQQNVAIGFYASVANGANSNQLSIQNVIYGTGMGNISTGKIGIGLSAPSEQLHTNAGVRFQGLTTGGTITSLVGADASGKLWRTTGVNNCASTGAIPRNDANANFICSQVYDNGITTTIGLGSATTQTWTSGGAQFGLAGDNITNPTNYRLYVVGWTRSQGYIATSDERLKTNIKVIQNASEKISKISGYTYDWKTDIKNNNEIDKNKQAGFLAQEIEKVLPEAVAKNSDGSYGLNYNAIIPLLTEGIKEQINEIHKLKLEVEELKAELNQRNNGSQSQNVSEYFQIVPNPVEQMSKIVYKLDNTSAKTMFIIYDLQGKMLKQIEMPKNTKEGQLPLNKSDLGKGMYILSLIISNNEVQSKRFLIL